MFACQSDVIIRSDVTSGVHLRFSISCYSGSKLYTMVIFLCEKKSTIASRNPPSYPFACIGVKVRAFRMPWNGSFGDAHFNSDALGILSCVSSTEVLSFSLMHSIDTILQKL